MEKLILIISIFLIFSCNTNKSLSIYTTTLQISNDSINIQNYKVIDIDSTGEAYLIYVKRNDSVFKVVTLKENVNPCYKIQVNKFYKLKLASSMGDKPQKLDISGIKVGENTLVMLDNTNGALHDLFLTDNIKGLCYIEW